MLVFTLMCLLYLILKVIYDIYLLLGWPLLYLCTYFQSMAAYSVGVLSFDLDAYLHIPVVKCNYLTFFGKINLAVEGFVIWAGYR